ncbi:MAG: SDR family oxidoreductase [Phycisphaerales bacterium JB039]
MDMSLKGRRAVVCGSTQGIGRAAAIELAELGATVTLLARDEGALRSAAAELPAPQQQRHGFEIADFAEPEQVRAAAERIARAGAVHILVNNTGGPPGGPITDADPAAFERGFRMHIINNQLLAQALIPGMKEAGFGRIINIISTSVKAPIPGLGVSNTIRGAVASWAKTLAGELAPFGITVNNVLPGFTDTARLASLFEARAQRSGSTADDEREQMRASIPAGRIGRPEEIAAAIAFLASPAASYINGINLPVDGGRLPTL